MTKLPRRLLITGATGGIGKQLSAYLNKSENELLLFARDKEKLKLLSGSLKSEVSTYPETYSLDLSNLDEINKFNFSELGRVDGLVLMPPQLDPVSDPFACPEAWETYFKSSFIGPLHFIKMLLPNLQQSDRAKIVIISGISSLQALSHYATSNVLRCAWVGQAKTLAQFLGKDNIHVNTLSLGGILTDEYQQELIEEAAQTQLNIGEILARETSNVPLKKYATPLEIAYAVEGLLGNFSNHITGVNIAVDGGFTKAY